MHDLLKMFVPVKTEPNYTNFTESSIEGSSNT